MSHFSSLPRRAGIILGMTGFLLGSATASAQTVPAQTPTGSTADSNTEPAAHSEETYTVEPEMLEPTLPDPHPVLHDIEAYYTSPLHWDWEDWAYFGGALGLLAVSHHYDTQVRTHFIAEGSRPIGGSTDDLKDAVPMIGAVVGTWAYANIIGSNDGLRETWNMVEAGGLSVVDSYALKFVAGRERPDQTSDPNKWRTSGGSSFPSVHAAGAFAIGAVLAESGNDDYRLLRRVLGYGAVAGYTAFERLKHNAHWLSDDVAGAEIGGATAHFVLERDEQRRQESNESSLSVVPIPGGAMLSYNLTIK
jgi:membrane-associated phospholipid phosphatase